MLECPVLETLRWVLAALLSTDHGLLLLEARDAAACDAAEHAWGALASCPTVWQLHCSASFLLMLPHDSLPHDFLPSDAVNVYLHTPRMQVSNTS